MTQRFIWQQDFQQLLDAARDAVVVVDSQGNVVALNQEAIRLFEWTREELLGEPMTRLVPARFERVLKTGPRSGDEPQGTHPNAPPVGLFARRRDGTEFPVEISRCPLGLGSDAFVLVTIRDLTEWRRTQESLMREKEFAFMALDSIGDAIITTDALCKVTYLNPVAERLTGWRVSEALGQPVDNVLTFISDASRQRVESTAARCLREGRPVDLAEGTLLLRRDGTEVTIEDSAAPILDRNGATAGVVVAFHDSGERRRVSRRLAHEATHDALTGLVNRNEFQRRLTRVLADARAGSDAAPEHVVCYLDLDRFKGVNDSCGHEAGDQLLQKIGTLMGARMRRGDTLARLGGDEFGALLLHCPLARAEEIAEELRKAIREFPFAWGQERFSLSVSIGLVAITGASGRSALVMRAADAACYAAKDGGGDRVHVDRLGGRSGAVPRVGNRRVGRLVRALEEDHFRLYAQAIVPLTEQPSERPRCEVLLRLPGERERLETPASFLPDAERSNLMPAIDRWVIRRTVALLGQWQQAHPGTELPLCSINLSASSLDDDSLVPAIQEYVTEHKVPAGALCLEVVEAAALGNFAETVRLISQLRGAGCAVALKDFGNGLNSFAHFKALRVDFLKIGGHFVRAVPVDPVYATIVGTVSQIGGLMGIATVAEEVDQEPVLQKLRTLGVGYAQGHAVAPPQPLVNSDGEVAFPRVQLSA